MNRRVHSQQLLDLELAAPASATPLYASVPARVREVSSPAARPAVARELWAAVQLGDWQGAAGESDEAFPAALAVLVRRAQGFTPRVAVESPDAVLLELAGSQRLFGGLPSLLAALRTAFPRPLQLALAPTPLAAVLLARAGRNCCITTPARLAGRLAPLSLRHLHWPEEETDRLRDMGVVTLGELLRLPREGLARRIGPERLAMLDRLTGARADPRADLVQPQRFAARVDPDHETVDRERLLAALRPVLVQLEDFLRARQRGVMALRLTLHHRHGSTVQCFVRCVVPEYRAARFAALLAARLEALLLAAPVRRMVLTAGRLCRFAATNAALWTPGEQGGDARAVQAPEFLQTLMARLGDRAVYGLATVQEHRPERAWLSTTPGLAAAATPAPSPAAAQASSAARPLALMREPLPLEPMRDPAGRVQGLRHAGRELSLVTGPERIESGWWDGGDVARDYYVARADDGAQWWIFRECVAPRRWFVHGCFA